MDKADVEVILNILGAAYNTKIDDGKVAAFHSILARIPRLYAYRAANDFMKFGKFFPRPSEIYGIARSMVEAGQFRNGWKPPEDASDEFIMWQMVKQGIDDPGKLPPELIDIVYRHEQRPVIGMQGVQE